MKTRLLFVTQKLDRDDTVLGFVYKWIQELKKNVDSISVLTLEKRSESPEGINSFSLGKETRQNKIIYFYKLYSIIIREIKRKKTNIILFHQGGPYPLLLFPIKLIFKVKFVLWYVHCDVDLFTKLSLPFIDKIFTAAHSSFNLKTEKVSVHGHGIDTTLFSPDNSERDKRKIIVAGRISRVKKLEGIVEAINDLCRDEDFKSIRIVFIGSTVTVDDERYLKEILKLIFRFELGKHFQFTGKINFLQMPSFYRNAYLSVSFGSEGSVDKVILESLATGTPAIMATKALENQLGVYSEILIVKNRLELIKGIKAIINMNKNQYIKMSETMRNIVLENHDLQKLMKKIGKECKDLKKGTI